MPLLFNYLKILDCFIGSTPVSQKIKYVVQRISVNLTNDCDGNQLNYNNDLPAIGNKNYALQKPFEIDFSTVISGGKRRPSFVIY